MILCDTEIEAALHSGMLVIEPNPSTESISTSAVDLQLDDQFRRWKVPRATGANVHIDPSAANFSIAGLEQDFLEACPLTDGGYMLQPGGFVLGITRERVEFPPQSRYAGRVEGRSTLARLGLGVHVTAPTIHAGFKGKITLEITNLGSLPILLRPGLKVCQLIVEQVSGTPRRTLQTVFQNQRTVTGGGGGTP